LCHDLDFLSSDFESTQTIFKLGDLSTDLLALGRENLIESLQELNKVGRSHIEDSLEFFFHPQGLMLRGFVSVRAQIRQGSSLIFRQLDRVEELLGDLDQCLLWPWHEPVDRRVVDQGGVLAEVALDGFTYG